MFVKCWYQTVKIFAFATAVSILLFHQMSDKRLVWKVGVDGWICVSEIRGASVEWGKKRKFSSLFNAPQGKIWTKGKPAKVGRRGIQGKTPYGESQTRRTVQTVIMRAGSQEQAGNYQYSRKLLRKDRQEMSKSQ